MTRQRSWHDCSVVEREVLHGGVTNAGVVIREGQCVLRPSNPRSELVHAFFRHVRAVGFDGVPEPVGVETDGRERLLFIPGDVAVRPFPAWSQTDEALASTAQLLARFHAAAQGFEPPPGAEWSQELADPEGGAVICHNDVCPENVVFRGAEAVALLDFDYAAPGRPIYDLASMARLWIPLDAPEHAHVPDRESFDPFERLRVVADSYGLPPGRAELVCAIEESMARNYEFVRPRVERGEPAFVKRWQLMGGQSRFDRRRDWFAQHRERFIEVLG